MKTIIAGSRGIENPGELVQTLKRVPWEITEVVSGTASGADRLGEEYAEEQGLPLTKMPADWDKHGKAAGPKRNREMAEHADCAVILWDGESRGSKNMINEAYKRGLWTVVYNQKQGRVVTVEPV